MPLAAGTRLGPYEIVAPLGAGGMGEVYRARDTRLGRSVAIKVLPPSFAASPEFRPRFAQAARALLAVDHPNICALYDVGAAAGVDFLVMALVEGETLAERLRRGPLAVAESFALAQQIAAGLEAAHERGILHRDLKPANIKLTPAGDVKILDFGLAKVLHPVSLAAADASVVTCEGTMPGVVLGTPAYMAPEQARGLPVDERADIWA